MIQREDLLHNVSVKTELEQDQVAQIYYSMVHIITDALSRGEKVDLNPEWGSFIPKQWNPEPNGNSQNPPKVAHYRIRFRPSKTLEHRLRISPE